MKKHPRSRSNFNVEFPEVFVKVYGDVAWAYNTHVKSWTDEKGDNQQESEKWDVRFLEKRDGKWKVAFFIDGSVEKKD